MECKALGGWVKEPKNGKEVRSWRVWVWLLFCQSWQGIRPAACLAGCALASEHRVRGDKKLQQPWGGRCKTQGEQGSWSRHGWRWPSWEEGLGARAPVRRCHRPGEHGFLFQRCPTFQPPVLLSSVIYEENSIISDWVLLSKGNNRGGQPTPVSLTSAGGIGSAIRNEVLSGFLPLPSVFAKCQLSAEPPTAIHSIPYNDIWFSKTFSFISLNKSRSRILSWRAKQACSVLTSFMLMMLPLGLALGTFGLSASSWTHHHRKRKSWLMISPPMPGDLSTSS